MRGAMDTVTQHTSDGKKLSEFSMVSMHRCRRKVMRFLHPAIFLVPQCQGKRRPSRGDLKSHAAPSPSMAGAWSLLVQPVLTPPSIPRQVFYNNMLSLPFVAALMAMSGEARVVWHEPDLCNPTFLLVAGLSGAISFGIRQVAGLMARLQTARACPASQRAVRRPMGIPACAPLTCSNVPATAPLTNLPSGHPLCRSFTSLWFLSTTTPSIYSLVGSLNKVPLAVIGLLAFNMPWTLPNLLSILVGTLAGVIFAVAKSCG